MIISMISLKKWVLWFKLNNIDVKSEIVVPLFDNEKNIGQIDVDSNNLNQFTKIDLNFLKKINEMISEKFLK